MKAITKDYLIDIIYRVINKTISIHRNAKSKEYFSPGHTTATDEEIFDFICFIPWFDNKLKDFLVGNLDNTTTIISQAWEIEFLKKAMLWSESFEWLQGDDYFLSDAHLNSLKKNDYYLTLPY